MALPTIPTPLAAVAGKERPAAEWFKWWKAVADLVSGNDSRIAALETALASRVGTMFYAMRSTPPAGALALDGSAVLIASYSALATAIYCGDADNGTASWGYKATTNVSPSSNRSTSGTYIVLPNGAGEFMRGWDNGRGVDSGRTLWSYQADELEAHTHNIKVNNVSNTTVTGGGARVVNIQVSGTNTATDSTGGSETRPRNLVGLACIWYRGVA